MIQTFINIFKIPELRNKVLFTLFLLAIYRIGFHVPLPGTDQEQFAQLNKQSQQSGDDSAGSRLANYVSLFSGGSLTQSTIFGLGIMPYISSSIIFQLLGTVLPSLEKLQQEGATGQKKIQEWSRYATVPICLVQAVMLLSSQYHHGNGSLLLKRFQMDFGLSFWIMGVVTLTSGSIFLMWLGEQIDEYGLGNGVSLIILAGIVARMPGAVGELIRQTNMHPGVPDANAPITPMSLLFLISCFCFVVAGSILITQAQRRIPIQQAKHTRGRHIYGGQRQYLPLRVNHGGVMPIIFAQSLMLFPTVAFAYIAKMGIGSDVHSPAIAKWIGGVFIWLSGEFGPRSFIYYVTMCAMIYFFAYFWTTVQFQPKEMANQLRDHGSFIPGLRPGKRTSDYLEKVMARITYVGAAFLCVIAVVPMAVQSSMNIPPQISAFLGGTGLLIVVSVALDMVQRIEANLLMRNYGGFLGGEGGKGKRIKGRQY